MVAAQTFTSDRRTRPHGVVRRSVASRAVDCLHPEPAALQRTHERSIGHRYGASGHQSLVSVNRHVIMIEVEPAQGNAILRSELMQFQQRGVADEMAPDGVVFGPDRPVDQDGHECESMVGSIG
jgi:hypothetical protein